MRIISGWGLPVFLISVLFSIGELFIARVYHFNIHDRILMPFGIGFSILAIVLANLSYPRVHNVKILLLGYFISIVSITLLIFSGIIPLEHHIHTQVILFLYLSLFTVLFISALIPPIVKYREANFITFSMIMLALAGILLVNYQIVRLPMEYIFNMHWTYMLLPAVFSIITFIITMFTRGNDFHLGGLISGMTVILCTGYYVISADKGNQGNADMLTFAGIPAILTIGILIHWISRIGHLAYYDPMLRIYNRGYCNRLLSGEIPLRKNMGDAIAIMDIDHFKRINDTHGHQFGDKVLVHTAHLLTEELIPEGILCRYGGEEFVVFLQGKDKKLLTKQMERVRKRIEATKIHNKNRRVKLTISIGISVRKNKEQELEDILKYADKALYASKTNGRNQVTMK